MIISNYKVKYFRKEEFSEDPTIYADVNLIKRLDLLRGFLNTPIFPSPAPGALARFDGRGSSRHYAKYRLSDAIDIFVKEDPFKTFSSILFSGYFYRVGVYFDTTFQGKPLPMFHLDLKPEKLLWMRVDGNYTYSTSPTFYDTLFEEFSQYGK